MVKRVGMDWGAASMISIERRISCEGAGEFIKQDREIVWNRMLVLIRKGEYCGLMQLFRRLWEFSHVSRGDTSLLIHSLLVPPILRPAKENPIEQYLGSAHSTITISAIPFQMFSSGPWQISSTSTWDNLLPRFRKNGYLAGLPVYPFILSWFSLSSFLIICTYLELFFNLLGSRRGIIGNVNCQNLVGEKNFMQQKNFMHLSISCWWTNCSSRTVCH
jgi:hypothetical protein